MKAHPEGRGGMGQSVLAFVVCVAMLVWAFKTNMWGLDLLGNKETWKKIDVLEEVLNTRMDALEKSIMERFDDNSKQVGALKDKLEYLNSLQAIGEKQRQLIYEAIVKVGTANDVSFKEYVKSFFLTSGGNTRHLE